MESTPEKVNEVIDSPERIRLRELENEGKWVFHGSRSKIDIFEPRQAYNHPANSEEGRIPDDKPAVFASPSADIAIFRAIINFKNAPRGARSGFGSRSDGNFEFRTTRETMGQIRNAEGYVYVFDKAKFTPRSSREVLSYEAVQPNEIVIVTEKDLPKGIVIKDF